MIERQALHQIGPEAQRALCEGIAQGLTRQQLAAVVGVTPGAIELWLAKGQKDLEGGLETTEAAIVKEAQRASARAQGRALEAIHAAIIPHRKVVTETTVIKGVPIEKLREETVPGDWQAAAWLLERTNPNQWGRRQVLAHVAADGGATYKRIMLDGPAPLDAGDGARALDLEPGGEVPGGTSPINGLTHLSLASPDPLDLDLDSPEPSDDA